MTAHKTHDDTETDASKFAGLSGLWKQWAGFGVIGVMSGLMCYVVMVQLPEMQKLHLETIEKTQAAAREEIHEERQSSRTDAAASRQHGSQAADKLADAINKNADAVNELDRTFREVQSRTQARQDTLIELAE